METFKRKLLFLLKIVPFIFNSYFELKWKKKVPFSKMNKNIISETKNLWIKSEENIKVQKGIEMKLIKLLRKRSVKEYNKLEIYILWLLFLRFSCIILQQLLYPQKFFVFSLVISHDHFRELSYFFINRGNRILKTSFSRAYRIIYHFFPQ